jgi:hypothetical protein
MKWAKDTGQQYIISKIIFYNVDDKVDWSFILGMLTCLGLGTHYIDMVNTLFTDASNIVLVNNFLSTSILLH